MISALLNVFPNTGARLGETLTLLPIAGEECDRAGVSFELREALWGALFPSPVLRGRGQLLYRAHVRELVSRARRGEDLVLATDAECLAMMMETALRAPLTAEGQAVAEHLFVRLFPDLAQRVLEGAEPAREKWAGQVAETLGVLRRKLRVESRAVKLPAPERQPSLFDSEGA